MKKRLIGLLMILTMIISLVTVPEMAKATTKSYLVLIETKEGKWTAYKDLAYESGDYLMVKASATSKALSLKYKNNDENLTIQNGKKKLTLTKNSKSYKYFNGSSTTKKTAKYKTYAPKIANKSTYVVYYDVLSNLSVYTQYYTGSKATDYKVLGYNGVICYSTVGKITSLPNIKNVVNTDGKKLTADTTTDNHNGNTENNNGKEVGYKGTITIGNTKIPKLTGFAGGNYNNGNWGADNYKDGDDNNDYLYDAIQDFSNQMKKDIAARNIDGNAGEYSGIKISNHSLIGQIHGSVNLSPLILSKKEDHYEIYISTRLSENPNPTSESPDYSKELQSILKVFCSAISSTSDKLYTAIYDSAETDNTHGINTSSWVTVGDSQIKVTINKGNIVYSIKAAN